MSMPYSVKGKRRKALRAAKQRKDRRTNFYAEHHEVDGIHYYIDGPSDAELTIVLIHGFTLAAKSWYLQVEHIRDRARCILMDLRGHGETGEWPAETCTIDAAADDVYRVIQAAGVQGPLIVAGHSLGGMIAVNLLRRYDDVFARTEHALLVATAVASFASQGVPQILASPIVNKIRDAVELAPKEVDQFREDIAALVAPTLAATVFSTPTPQYLVNFHAEMINDTPLETFVGFLDALQHHSETNLNHKLDNLEGTVLVGEQDYVTPLSQAEIIVGNWPKASMQVIPGAGHMLPLEQPWMVDKAFDLAIDEVLAKVS